MNESERNIFRLCKRAWFACVGLAASSKGGDRHRPCAKS